MATSKSTKEKIEANPPFTAIEHKKDGISFWSKIKFFIQLRSGFWSTILAFFMYYFVGVFVAWGFGWDKGFYDPSFIQPIFLAGAVVLAACSFVQFILYFDFRTLHRYIWGKYREEDKDIVNYSKADFKLLTSWQRIAYVGLLFSVLLIVIVVVYLKMVAPTQTDLPK